MTTRDLRFVLCLAAVAACAVAQPITRDLIDDRLELHRVAVIAIDSDSVTLARDPTQVLHPIADTVALLTPQAQWRGFTDSLIRFASTSASRPHVIELTDGQRLAGRLTPSPESDTIQWATPGMGAAPVRLDRVRRIVLARTDRPQLAPSDLADAVALLNGDVVRGFITSDGSSIIVETDAGDVRLELARIAEITLANPVEPARHPLIWLDDGSIIAASSIRTGARGVIAFEAALFAQAAGGSGDAFSAEVSARPERIAGILFHPRRVVTLAALDVIEHEPIASRRWAPPPRIDDPAESLLALAGIELSGPVRTVWRLPPGASRLAAHVSLPPQARAWGDVRLTFSSIDASGRSTLLASERLDASAPDARVRIDLSPDARRIEIRVEPGRHGPVHNTVVLSRPIVLLAAD